MSCDTFELILKEIKKIKPRVVVLYHGGEPFLNKNIFEMITALKSIGIETIKIVTNGMLLTDDLLEKIIKSDLDVLEFSLDGKTPEENDSIRLGCNYQKVSSIIKNLIEKKRYLNVKKPEIFIANIQFPTEEELRGGKPGIPDYLIKDFSQYSESEIEFKVYWLIYWPGMPIETSQYKLINLETTEKPLNYCEHPIDLITIRYNGDVVPCCYDTTSEYVLGNIHHSSVKKIWNNEKYRKLRKTIKDGKLLPLCKNCPVLNPNCYLIKK